MKKELDYKHKLEMLSKFSSALYLRKDQKQSICMKIVIEAVFRRFSFFDRIRIQSKNERYLRRSWSFSSCDMVTLEGGN